FFSGNGEKPVLAAGAVVSSGGVVGDVGAAGSGVVPVGAGLALVSGAVATGSVGSGVGGRFNR
ncbi:actin family protein, partial [Candidatus Saccharibacteria bacterium]|nr:actin family protein [Candidatus Saccharibacteria bacterium]